MKPIIILFFLTITYCLQGFAQAGLAGAAIRQGRSEIADLASKEGSNLYRNAIDRLGKAISIYKSAEELSQAIKTLKKGECLPDYSVNPQAMVPSFCLDDSTGRCGICYDAAYLKLNDARRRLGRLKCMGLTMKNFVAKSISFGDNVASIHAVQGLAWQQQRKGIMEAYSKFKTAYDSKYKELMDLLTAALLEIDTCESKNGQADWFQRFGFMYVEFMAEKYKRVE